MKFPDDITELLKRKFKNNHREWLKAGGTWPLEINLDIPSEQNAIRQTDVTRSWISAWKSWQGGVVNNGVVSGGTSTCIGSCRVLVWSERRWRSFGTQNVPEKLILESPEDVALWAGETARWLRAVERFKLLIQRWPILTGILPKYFNVLADYSDSDFFNLSEIIAWICANPKSNLYIRQIPVANIDSKWLESRRGLVYALVAAIQNYPAFHSENLNEKSSEKSNDLDFFSLCGLRPQPQMIRMRILDQELRNKFCGLSDISAPLGEIAKFEITPAVVFIIENIQTALAFNDIKNSILFMGLGYGVDVLAKIPWLLHARCLYWGDIDTHGFAILNRARSYLPDLESILMNEKILLNHRELWVEEKDQYSSAELSLLTNCELQLFQSLKNNIWGYHVRLEQERIRWDEAWNYIRLV